MTVRPSDEVLLHETRLLKADILELQARHRAVLAKIERISRGFDDACDALRRRDLAAAGDALRALRQER